MSNAIIHDIERPPPDVIEALRRAAPYPVAYAGPLSGGHGRALDPSIRPLRAGVQVLGPAVTVAIKEPDHLIPMYAIEVAQPDDVLVVSVGGRTEAAVWGGSMTKSATTRRLAGVVIDGAVCDSTWLSRPEPYPGVSVPVFAKAVSAAHSTWSRPGSINVPIECGGVTVSPGDLVVGGDDGVVIVPAEDLADLVDRIEHFAGEAAQWHAEMDGGRTWFEVLNLEPVLRSLGIEERSGKAGGP